MILAVFEAGASDAYEGKANRNDWSNHMYNPNNYLTVLTNKKLFCTVSWKLWKIKIGWDYLFVKADQCQIVFLAKSRNLSPAKCMRSIFAEISNNEVVNVRECKQMFDKNMNCETFYIF